MSVPPFECCLWMMMFMIDLLAFHPNAVDILSRTGPNSLSPFHSESINGVGRVRCLECCWIPSMRSQRLGQGRKRSDLHVNCHPIVLVGFPRGSFGQAGA